MERYSVIKEKRPREIVLLRGTGCVYKKCTFCDYYADSCENGDENYALNKRELEKITGIYREAEIINSGSVFELDGKTLALIKDICRQRQIETLHFESHYLYREKIPALRKDFAPVKLKMKLGLETFGCELRENILNKGINEKSPEKIAKQFDEANLLFGITGQTEESMLRDIELGLKYFERLCVNIMCENTATVKPDGEVTALFRQKIYPLYRDNDRIDILLNNTDFGVGD